MTKQNATTVPPPSANDQLHLAEEQVQAAADKLSGIRTVVENIDKDLVAAGGKLALLEAERKRISFAAYAGDAPARDRLEQLHGSIVEASSQVAAAKAAQAEGSQHVAAATAAWQAADERRQAHMVLAEIDAVAAATADLDFKAKGFFESVSLAADRIAKLAAQSSGKPSTAQLRAYLLVALKTHAISARFPLDIGDLPPTQRRQFSDLLGGWLGQVRDWANKKIAETKP